MKFAASARGVVFVALPEIRDNQRAFGQLCRSFPTVHVASRRELAMTELAALGDEITAAIIGVKERINIDALEALPNLRVVGSVGTGTDHLDMAALRERGVRVVTTPGVNAVSVAEHAMMMILSLAKRTLSGHSAVMEGRDRGGMPEPPIEVRGRRVGILGAGATARALLPMLRAFGTDAAVWTRSPEKHADLPLIGLSDLFRRSDIISVHLPLTESTRGLVNATLLELLPEGALLVNTARKEIIDLTALPSLISTRPDLRFAVDDFGLAADGTASLLGDAALMSPHSAGVTVEALRAMQDLAVRETIRAVTAPST
jgi:phosphoglycerate dehydrogenase-like enzyme